MSNLKKQKIDEAHELVKSRYGQVAKAGSGCCGPVGGCCSGQRKVDQVGLKIGYSHQQLEAVPEGANLGLGCGNPTAIDSLCVGDVVLDLGSGAGMDAFVAASQVGPSGNVIGVDMTPEMVDKARQNAQKINVKNVEFRQGQIESLPVENSSVDAVISNCVINLSPDKKTVFEEAYRVLKPGGKLMVSDIVLDGPLPKKIEESAEAYVGCISGASFREDYLRLIVEAGFEDVQIVKNVTFADVMSETDPFVAGILQGLNLTAGEVRASLQQVRSLGVLAVKKDSEQL